MTEQVVLVVVMAGAQLAYSLVALRTWPARDRARAEVATALLRAAGPGAVVRIAAPDGSVLTVRTAPAPAAASPAISPVEVLR